MNEQTLSSLPDWPALMDSATAVRYLGGKRTLLVSLEDRGFLSPLTARHRCRTYRRVDLDAALELARHRGMD